MVLSLCNVGIKLFLKFSKRVFSKSVSSVIMLLTDTVRKELRNLNEHFYQLPEDKRNNILSAGFRVFSQYSYKNSPMSEIAAEAGISKSMSIT